MNGGSRNRWTDWRIREGNAARAGERIPPLSSWGTNRAEALKWYRKAAEQGDAIAQEFLGTMYEIGEDTPKDYVESYKWTNLSAAQGNEEAKKALPRLESKMTKEQITEAQRLFREFKPRTSAPPSSR